MNPLEMLQLARADPACYAVAQWPGFELARRIIACSWRGLKRSSGAQFGGCWWPCRHGMARAYSPPNCFRRGIWGGIPSAPLSPPATDKNSLTASVAPSEILCGIPCTGRSSPAVGLRRIQLACTLSIPLRVVPTTPSEGAGR